MFTASVKGILYHINFNGSFNVNFHFPKSCDVSKRIDYGTGCVKPILITATLMINNILIDPKHTCGSYTMQIEWNVLFECT